jgi:hypothetical protein
MELYHDQRNAQVFNSFVSFTSALHVSGFLLAYLQRQCTVQFCQWFKSSCLEPRQSCIPTSEDGLKESPKHVRQK